MGPAMSVDAIPVLVGRVLPQRPSGAPRLGWWPDVTETSPALGVGFEWPLRHPTSARTRRSRRAGQAAGDQDLLARRLVEDWAVAFPVSVSMCAARVSRSRRG